MLVTQLCPEQDLNPRPVDRKSNALSVAPQRHPTFMGNRASLILQTSLRVNSMQSETADFGTGAATWRTGRNIPYASFLILAYSLHYMKT